MSTVPNQRKTADNRHLDPNDLAVLEGCLRAVDTFLTCDESSLATMKIKVGFNVDPPTPKQKELKSVATMQLQINALANLPRPRLDILRDHENRKNKIPEPKVYKDPPMPSKRSKRKSRSKKSSTTTKTPEPKSPRMYAGCDDSQTSTSSSTTSVNSHRTIFPVLLDGALSALRDTILGTHHEQIKWKKLPSKEPVVVEQEASEMKKAVMWAIPSPTVYAVKGSSTWVPSDGKNESSDDPIPVSQIKDQSDKLPKIELKITAPEESKSDPIDLTKSEEEVPLSPIKTISMSEESSKVVVKRSVKPAQYLTMWNPLKNVMRPKFRNLSFSNPLKSISFSNPLKKLKRPVFKAPTFSNPFKGIQWTKGEVNQAMHRSKIPESFADPGQKTKDQVVMPVLVNLEAAKNAALNRLILLIPSWNIQGTINKWRNYCISLMRKYGRKAAIDNDSDDNDHHSTRKPYRVNRAQCRAIPSSMIYAVKGAGPRKETKIEEELSDAIPAEEVKKEVVLEKEGTMKEDVTQLTIDDNTPTADTKTAGEISIREMDIAAEKSQKEPTPSSESIIPGPTIRTVGQREALEESSLNSPLKQHIKDDDTLRGINSIEETMTPRFSESDTNVITDGPATPEAIFNFYPIPDERKSVELSFQIFVRQVGLSTSTSMSSISSESIPRTPVS